MKNKISRIALMGTASFFAFSAKKIQWTAGGMLMKNEKLPLLKNLKSTF
jgi:hypothetical protein